MRAFISIAAEGERERIGVSRARARCHLLSTIWRYTRGCDQLGGFGVWYGWVEFPQMFLYMFGMPNCRFV